MTLLFPISSHTDVWVCFYTHLHSGSDEWSDSQVLIWCLVWVSCLQILSSNFLWKRSVLSVKNKISERNISPGFAMCKCLSPPPPAPWKRSFQNPSLSVQDKNSQHSFWGGTVVSSAASQRQGSRFNSSLGSLSVWSLHRSFVDFLQML